MNISEIIKSNFEENNKVNQKCIDDVITDVENALDINGISFASWDVKTKMCNVTFNTSKISEKKIHETLANVGHDTQLCKASNETYNNLHPCCQYVRKDSL